ncbi:hypothetical protein BGZ97_012986 [Linnemannia gamsii]|uniref:Uncharacterized protein n=1 Tax=Linnemannia gamsii TaxID=64522 RepID=A0A9P6R271_9FUNG|nr:hypothetical protein BGZ97_012986 [Linnemannia gamsii]
MPGGGTREDWSKVAEYLRDYNSNSRSNRIPVLDSVTPEICQAAWGLLEEEQEGVLEGVLKTRTNLSDIYSVEDSTQALRVRRRAIQWLLELEINKAYVNTATTIPTTRHRLTLPPPPPPPPPAGAVVASRGHDLDATEVQTLPPSEPTSTSQKGHMRSDSPVKTSYTPAVETTETPIIEIADVETTETPIIEIADVESTVPPQPQENSSVPVEECPVEQDDISLIDDAQALSSHRAHVPTSASAEPAIVTPGQSVPPLESEPTPATLDKPAGMPAPLDDPARETTLDTNASPPIQENVDPSQDSKDMDELSARIQKLKRPRGTTIKQLRRERDDRGEMVETLWKQMQELTTRQEKLTQESQGWKMQRQQALEREQELVVEKGKLEERLAEEKDTACKKLESERQNYTARLDAERKAWRGFREQTLKQREDSEAELARLETQLAVDKAKLETLVAVEKARLMSQMADEKARLETQIAVEKRRLELQLATEKKLGMDRLAAEKTAHTEEIRSLNANWTQKTTQESNKQQQAMDKLRHEWQEERAFLLSSIEKLQAALNVAKDAGPSPSSVPPQHRHQQERQFKAVEVELKRSRQEVMEMQQRIKDVEQLNRDFMEIIKTQVSTIHTATQENARKRRKLDADKIGNKENQ